MAPNLHWRFYIRVALLLVAIAGAESQMFKRVCYFTNWSCDLLVPEAHFCLQDIDPNLCSHIIYGFVNINVTSYSLTPSRVDDESKDNFVGRYVQFNNLRNQHPHLKTLLSVGGSKMSHHFNSVTATATSRKKFAANCVDYVRKWGFDGLDLDWEYPGQSGGRKEALSWLVQDIRKADKELTLRANASSILVSVAGPASDLLVDQGFEVDIISQHVDFINLMAYDLQGAWSDITGFNSPLFPRQGDWRFHPKHCVEWVVKMWLDKGAPPSKLVLGIAGYGQSYTLKQINATTVSSSRTAVTSTKVFELTTTPTSQRHPISMAIHQLSDSVQDSNVHTDFNTAPDRRTNSSVEGRGRADMSTKIKGGNHGDKVSPTLTAGRGVIPELRMSAGTPSLPVPGIGSPAFGPGRPGRLRHLNGQLSFPEICEFINNGGHVVWNQEQRVPFMTLDDLWVGYDDERSVVEKVTWAVSQNLGGIMFWSLDLDDFTGKYCNKGTYPLLSAISETVTSLDILKNELEREMTDATHEIKRGRQSISAIREGELLANRVPSAETDNPLRPYDTQTDGNLREEDKLSYGPPTQNLQVVHNNSTPMVGGGPRRNARKDVRGTNHRTGEWTRRSHHFSKTNDRPSTNAYNYRHNNNNSSILNKHDTGNTRWQDRAKDNEVNDRLEPGDERRHNDGNTLDNERLVIPEKTHRRRGGNRRISAAMTLHPRRDTAASRFASRHTHRSDHDRYTSNNRLILSEMNRNFDDDIENINGDRDKALHGGELHSGDTRRTKTSPSVERRRHGGGHSSANNNFNRNHLSRNNLGNAYYGGTRHGIRTAVTNDNSIPRNGSLNDQRHKIKPVINRSDFIDSEGLVSEDSGRNGEEGGTSGANGFQTQPVFSNEEDPPRQRLYLPNQPFMPSSSRVPSPFSSLRPTTVFLVPTSTLGEGKEAPSNDNDDLADEIDDYVDNSQLDETVNEYDYYIAFVNNFQPPPDTTIPPHDAFTYARQSGVDVRDGEVWTSNGENSEMYGTYDENKEIPNSPLGDDQRANISKATSGTQENLAGTLEGAVHHDDGRKTFYTPNSGHCHRMVMVCGLNVLILIVLFGTCFDGL